MIKPPRPTTHGSQDEAEQGRKRQAALLPMVLGLLAIGAFSVYAFWDEMKPQRGRPIVTGELRDFNSVPVDDTGKPPGGQADPHSLVPTDPSALLLTFGGDRVLLGEPAGLPPLEGGQRLGAFTRRDGHVVEEVSFWQVSGASAGQLGQQYVAAAAEIGFRELDDRQVQPGEVVNRVLVRSATPQNRAASAPRDDTAASPAKSVADQVLVVRATPGREGATRLLLWFRYTSTQPH